MSILKNYVENMYIKYIFYVLILKIYSEIVKKTA